MFGEFIEPVAQYGPLPLGILLGVFIKHLSHKATIKFAEKSVTALHEQNKGLYDIIKSKDERIQKLHDQISDLQGVNGPTATGGGA